MYKAGSVKMAPATTELASPPMPVMITFSRTLERQRTHAEATVKTTHRNTPQPTERG